MNFKLLPKPQKQYGLIKQPKNLNGVFVSGENLEEEEEERSVDEELRIIEQKKKQKQIKQLQEEALSEDPTIFDYDEVYDELKGKQELEHKIKIAQQREKSINRTPKYIQMIQKRAEQRKIEQEIIYERKLEKEREAEGEEYKDKPKFITSAYKEELMKRQKWKEEEAARLAKEEDITKKEDLTGLYGSLLETGLGFRNLVAAVQPKSKSTSMSPEEKKKNTLNANQTSPNKRKLEDEQKSIKSKEGEKEEKKLADHVLSSKEAEKEIPKEISKDIQKSKEQAEKEQLQKKLQRRNDESSISDARARYLARKAAKQE